MAKVKIKLPKIPKLKLKIANAYFVSTISITFVLVLTSIILLLILNGKQIVRKARESVQLIVIIKPDVPESQILLFQKELDKQKFIKSTDYISKQQGLEEMKAYLGNDIVDLLDYNPLPAVINVYLNAKYTSEEQIDKIIQWLTSRDQVSDVLMNQSLIYQLNKNIRFISSILGVITFLFILIALSLINNTIRLVVYSKRQEIKTMQLVGANNWFILKPFLFNSALQGFLAGLIADAIIVLSLVYVKLASKVSFEVYGLDIVLILTVIIGILITGITTYFAVKRFLWASDEEIWG